MKKDTPVLLFVDQDVAAKLVDLAGDEARVSQCLAVLLQDAEQQNTGNEGLVKSIEKINELIDKQAEYQIEIRTLHRYLRQVIANNQELLATIHLLTGSSPWQMDHTGFGQCVH